MTTIVVADDEASETPTEEAGEAVAEAVDDMAEAIDDAQDHAIDIDHAERLVRLEDAFTVLSATVGQVVEQVQTLASRESYQEERIEQVAEQQQEIATEAADAIETVAEETEAASEEITPDEMPATRTHPFFRRWGSGR